MPQTVLTLALLVASWCPGYNVALDKGWWSVNDDGCGKTRGCFRIPENCVAGSDCIYFLSWQNESGPHSNWIRFQFATKFFNANQSWAGFGVTDQQGMPGATVVDCIVNGSAIAIQMSYNDDHSNSVLTDKYLGLVKDSLQGSFVDGHLVCSFTRLRVTNSSSADHGKVRNLTSPYYILFATGPTNATGVKMKHFFSPKVPFDPFYSSAVVDFNKYSNETSGQHVRNPYVRAHATLMIFVWMVVASLGMFTSRYMKNQWKESRATCGKPVWFQVHRMSMAGVLVITAVGMLLIFAHKDWTFIKPDVASEPTSLHPSLGIAVGSLILANLIAGMLRPTIYSPYRTYFRWLHALLGHTSHLLAAVTMYFGVMQAEADLPSWSRWVVVGFACWRLLSDVVMSLVGLICKDAPVDYVAIANNEVDEDVATASAWRCAVMIVYMIGAVILAGTLIVLVNVPY